MKRQQVASLVKIAVLYKWWGGLSSLDKLGNKDKSICRRCKWRLFSLEISTGKQATNINHDILGATAEVC